MSQRYDIDKKRIKDQLKDRDDNKVVNTQEREKRQYLVDLETLRSQGKQLGINKRAADGSLLYGSRVHIVAIGLASLKVPIRSVDLTSSSFFAFVVCVAYASSPIYHAF